MEIIDNVFSVTFTNAAAAKKAKQIAEESFRSLYCDDYTDDPYELAADSLYIKNDVTLTFEELCFFSADLIRISRKVVKAIATKMKDETFEFFVCGCDTYEEKSLKGELKEVIALAREISKKEVLKAQ